MSSVARHVRYHVRRDPNLHLGRTRDVISHAKLARWLQREKGLTGSENAIIAALRRMDMDEEEDTLQRHAVADQGKDAAYIRVLRNGHFNQS